MVDGRGRCRWRLQEVLTMARTKIVTRTGSVMRDGECYEGRGVL